MYWKKVSEHLMYGCANPGIVLPLDPMLIAVSTDLTMGEVEYPVVRIIQKKLLSLCGKPPRVGTFGPNGRTLLGKHESKSIPLGNIRTKDG
jgi:hypothetical protein